jgi:hypothetical protein
MTYIPVAQSINSNKVDGTFYPLQKDELIALRQSRLINNAAFLYQLPKQPVEQLGCRGEVKTARDFGGYTIEHMKKMYGNKWEEAARYFGLEVD